MTMAAVTDRLAPAVAAIRQPLLNRRLKREPGLALATSGCALSAGEFIRSAGRLVQCQYWVRRWNCSLWTGLRLSQLLSWAISCRLGPCSVSRRSSQSAACCSISSLGAALCVLSRLLPCSALLLCAFKLLPPLKVVASARSLSSGNCRTPESQRLWCCLLR